MLDAWSSEAAREGGTRSGAVVSSSPEMGHPAAGALGGVAAGGRGCAALGGVREGQEDRLVLQRQWGECNTRFIKGHKPSNHIRARIKSHVYTTE